MTAYLKTMRRFGGMSGRASRAEYWGFYLVLAIMLVAAAVLDEGLRTTKTDMGVGIIFASVWAIHIFPQIAVMVRRLHDLDHTGWLFLIAFTGIGGLVLLVFACMRGTAGPNRFGPSPYGEPATAPQGAAMAQPAAPRDAIAEIERLAQLKASGSLSEAEFEVMKAKALTGRG